MRSTAILFVILIYSQSVLLLAQSKNNEVSFRVDNDAFKSFTSDRYYTSGGYISYAWKSKKYDFIINSISLNQRLFTPEKINFINVSQYDRPYAGTLSLTLSKSLNKSLTHLSGQLELGVLGPSSGAEQFHKLWHKTFGFYPPQGWENQISDRVICNFNTQYDWMFLKTGVLDLSTNSKLVVGNLFTNLSQGVLLRIGKKNDFKDSAHYSASLSRVGNDNFKLVECYFFINPNYERVLYNSTISGGKASIHNEEIEKQVLRNQIGLIVSLENFDFKFVLHQNTPETKESFSHNFLQIMLSQRF